MRPGGKKVNAKGQDMQRAVEGPCSRHGASGCNVAAQRLPGGRLVLCSRRTGVSAFTPGQEKQDGRSLSWVPCLPVWNGGCGRGLASACRIIFVLSQDLQMLFCCFP